MQEWFSRLILQVIRYRSWWIALLLVLSLLGTYMTATRLQIDNSVSIWFLEDNPDYQSYLEFQHERGSDEIVIAMLPVADALDKESRNILAELHQKVDTLAGVHATFSLANAEYPIYAQRRLYYRLIYPPEREREQVDRLLKELPAIRHQLIGPAGQHLFFYAQLDPTDKLESSRNAIVSQVETAIRQVAPTARISGQPILNEAFNASIYRESNFFAVATVIMICLLLLWLLPHWCYLPIALAGVAVPISVLMGIMMSLGYSLNLISMLIPTILMVYSVSDGVHIINIFHQEAQQQPHLERTQLIVRALKHSLKPCFYTTLTTVIGYLALCLSPLPAFKIMGFFTFLGMGLAFVVVYLITAIGFSYLPVQFIQQDGKETKPTGTRLLAATVERINYWTTHRSSLILSTALLLGIAGIGALTQIEVNTDSLHLLGEEQAKADLFAIEEVLGGNARFQIDIRHRQDSSMLKLATLDSLASFQAFVTDHPQLATPVSILNFRDFLRARSTPLAMFSSANAAQVLAQVDTTQARFFSPIAANHSALSISVNVRELETRELAQLLVNIEDQFTQRFDPARYELSVQGFLALFAQLNDFILQTQFRSFGLAFLLAFGILMYLVGDWRTSLLVLLPNLLPLLLTAIVMALSGIALEAANAMLAPIMLGVAMDDTIHYLHSYQHQRRQGLGQVEALDQGLRYTGSALLATTIALGCGFLVVAASGVTSVRTFGLLCAFTVAVALVADVVVLPALLKSAWSKDETD